MFQPTAIETVDKPVRLSDANLSVSVVDSKKQYQKQLKHWQQKLLQVQQAYYHQNKRAIIVLEGWDASGKGGLIRRLTEKLDPRGFRVYPIGKPNAEEQGRHYLFRFQQALPPPGQITIFDRSYYGRVLVERIEHLATENEWQRAYQEINEFERTLVDDGVRIVKLFMHISPEEQLERFAERIQNPVKQWKITQEDIRNREKWLEYIYAIDQMFASTSTKQVPWQLIAAEFKWSARIEGLQRIFKLLSEGVDLTPPPIDPQLADLAQQKLGIITKF